MKENSKSKISKNQTPRSSKKQNISYLNESTTELKKLCQYKIEQSMSRYNKERKKTIDLNKERGSILGKSENQAQHVQNQIPDGFESENNIHLNNRIFTESSTEEPVEIVKLPFFKEWTYEQKESPAFEKFEDLAHHYVNTFQRKIIFSKKKNECLGDTVKLNEKMVISKVYEELRDNENNVTFEKVVGFFEQCTLYYRVYNIHPNSLMDVIKQSAHKFEDKLTQEEFMNIFLLNTRTNEDYEHFNVQKIIRKCIFDEEGWAQLKEIFDIFDTFGNETIQIQHLFLKIKNNSQYAPLLKKQAIIYPSISRVYTLEKILFELENKILIKNHLKWIEFRQLIEGFSHISQPSIDVIWRNNLNQGKIKLNSNGFMLKDQIIDQIQIIFNKCPKYCDKFVKIRTFCDEVFQAVKMKSFLNELVRTKPNPITLRQELINLKCYQLQYLDLDELLIKFALKCEEHEKGKRNSSTASSDSSDSEFHQKRKEQIRINKSYQNLPKKYYTKAQNNETTRFQQFNLSKKEKITIREEKVKKMIKQNQMKEQNQLNSKFKANPIPASINPQKYKQYKEEMNKRKENLLATLNFKKQKDILILQHLQANTKLFQKKKPTNLNFPEKKYHFEANPVPWFAQIDLLQKINQERQQKRLYSKRSNKQMYQKLYWKNLPTFLQDKKCISEQVIQDEELKSQFTILAQMEKNITKKVKEMPNFQLLHKMFEEQLQSKFIKNKPTVIEQFNLTKPRQKKNVEQPKLKQKCLKRNYSQDNFIGSTLKYDSYVQYNRKKYEQTLKTKEIKQMELKQRKQKEKVFARFVQKQLKKELKSANLKSERSKELNNSMRMRKRQNEQQLARMYERVFERPFLFQNKSSGKIENKKQLTNIKPIVIPKIDERKNLFVNKDEKVKEKWIQEIKFNNQDEPGGCEQSYEDCHNADLLNNSF